MDSGTIDYPQAFVDAIVAGIAAQLSVDHGSGSWVSPLSGDYPVGITYNGADISQVSWHSGVTWTYHYNAASQLVSITES